MKKLKSSCCKSYKKKGKGCKGCPVLAPLSKKARRKLLRRVKKKRR